MIGVELDADLAKRTANNLKGFKNVSIITENILTNIPANADIIYLFNPFNREIMTSFLNTLEEIFINKIITLIYNNCIFLDLFRKNKNYIIEKEFKVNYHRYSHSVAIIKLNADVFNV